jgi:hypothetical protein
VNREYLIHKSGCLDSIIACFCLSGGAAATFATLSVRGGSPGRGFQFPLLVEEETSVKRPLISENDPKRTFSDAG